MAMIDREAFIAARKAAGLSQPELASLAKVSQQLVSAIESGSTNTTKHLLRFSRSLNVPPHKLDPEWAGIDLQDDKSVIGALMSSGNDFPIHASAEGGPGQLIMTPDPVDFMPRPAPVMNVKRAYGLYITGESMEPEFEAGDIALVNPHLPLVPGTTCIFFREIDGEARATIKRLRRVTTDGWQVRQWNPPEGQKQDFTLKREDWPTAHRVLGKYSRP